MNRLLLAAVMAALPCAALAQQTTPGRSTTSTSNAFGSVTVVGTPHLANTVAGLPVCNASTKGLGSYYVTDATTPTYNGALTGGGAVVVTVFCNGTAWTSQ